MSFVLIWIFHYGSAVGRSTESLNDETYQKVVNRLLASIAEISAELDRRKDETRKQFVGG